METALEQAENERSKRMLDTQIDHFILNYAPKDDPYYTRRFHVELHSLVRAIYDEATKPYQKIIGGMSLNFPPFVVGKPE